MGEGHDESEAAELDGGVTETGVFQVVQEGYEAVYAALSRSETFNRLWRTNAYGSDFPDELAHIGFLTLPEAQRMRDLLQLSPDAVLADVACGGGGPGLWMARETGASLIGVDPASAGLAVAERRAADIGMAARARFAAGTFEQTGLEDAAVDAVMSVEAFQYAPDKRAACTEFARILRPGGRVAIICFEVDPARVEGVPVLGLDPVADYRPLLEAAGLVVETYEETPGWEDRVHRTFGTLIANGDVLTAEMGERAAYGTLAEATLTVSIKPYPRRVLAVASRPPTLP